MRLFLPGCIVGTLLWSTVCCGAASTPSPHIADSTALRSQTSVIAMSATGDAPRAQPSLTLQRYMEANDLPNLKAAFYNILESSANLTPFVDDARRVEAAETSPVSLLASAVVLKYFQQEAAARVALIREALLNIGEDSLPTALHIARSVAPDYPELLPSVASVLSASVSVEYRVEAARVLGRHGSAASDYLPLLEAFLVNPDLQLPANQYERSGLSGLRQLTVLFAIEQIRDATAAE